MTAQVVDKIIQMLTQDKIKKVFDLLGELEYSPTDIDQLKERFLLIQDEKKREVITYADYTARHNVIRENLFQFFSPSQVKGMEYIESFTYKDQDRLQHNYHFWMDKLPVTNLEYRDFLKDLGSHRSNKGIKWADIGRKSDEHSECLIYLEGGQYKIDAQYKDFPVTGVNWYGANAYAEWKEKKWKEKEWEGKRLRFRLPDVREWEYAALGGPKPDLFRFAGSSDPLKVAWFEANSSGMAQEVGKKKPNKLGIHDLSGNIWEWCRSSETSAKTAICKGGSWFNDEKSIEINSKRIFNKKLYRSNIGFRCVCEKGKNR